MAQVVIQKAKNAAHMAVKRNARLYASDEHAKSESLLRAAEDNQKLGRASEAKLLASVAFTKAQSASTEAEIGEGGFRDHLLGANSSLRNQLQHLKCEVDARRPKLLPEDYIEYHWLLNRAADALARCASRLNKGQLLNARGEAVQADLLLHDIRTALDLNIRLSERMSGLAKR